MRTHQLPGVPLAVTSICLGTGALGSPEVPPDRAFALYDAYAAGGGNFLDTAHVYASWIAGGEGASETCIGAWLRARGNRDRVVVASKGAHPELSNMNRSRLDDVSIASDIDDSRRRLGVDTIDLWYLHRDDPKVPVKPILECLAGHIRLGHVRAVAASNWGPARLAEAATLARTNGLPAFAASQIEWSLAARSPKHPPGGGCLAMDAATLAYHAASGLAQVPFSAQANGFFAKDLAEACRKLAHYDTPANRRRWHAVRRIAGELGATPNAVALAWLLQHPHGGFAIVGPKTVAQVEDSLTAGRLTLTAAQWQELADER
jgi:aryl-alcohol dehydrogenase-like predicted oxidoreductase